MARTTKVKKATTSPKPTKKRVGEAPKKKTAKKTTTAEVGVNKVAIIKEFQTTSSDTGSPEVQVALLTQRISRLVAHLHGNPTDDHSRRGLLGMVSKRRRLLNYLHKKDETRYKTVVSKLHLKK